MIKIDGQAKYAKPKTQLKTSRGEEGVAQPKLPAQG
jgi:hypothetical protein